MPFNAHLFANQLPEATENKAIFKKAALMYDFDIKNDFSGFGESEIELLKAKAYQRVDGKYVLEEDFRNDVIKNEIGINNVVVEIEKYNIKTDFANTLRKTIQIPQNDYQKLTTPELFYSSKIVDILPNQLNAQALQAELQHRDFFTPFERITLNFAGRRKELDQISEYVDWLPKKGLGNILSNVFRNALGRHDKPPMLIQGIGGIGKSTLVAQFILEQNRNRNGKTLPFVYVDFDLPGFTLKEPLNILIESLRQLAIQYPTKNEIFERVRQGITELIFNKKNLNSEIGNFSKHQSSNASTRGLIYNSIDDIIRDYLLDLKAINTPVLIVFDSFEEMQYRATRDELNSFFAFIKEISDKIPRLRPIFVGRSEISERLGDFDFERIELKDFDKESAQALLKKYGIEDQKLCLKIFENLGGNPLVLQLAADLVKKEPDSIKDFGKIKNAKQEYLIRRIMEHIHDADVRKIAVPGMLIRSITPEIIKEVLAEPCQIGIINIKKAEAIFDELRKEAALISRASGNDEIAFRQDLRMACEKMIWDKYPKEAKDIQANVIAYYKKRKDNNEVNQAEYYFHLLKKGEIPEELDKKTYEKIRKYLESSLKEFPSQSQIFISKLFGTKISQTIVNKSSDIEVENYYLSQIKRGLNKELDYLKILYKEISINIPDSSDLQFSLYEALLCQRLNKLNESNAIIDKILSTRIKLLDYPDNYTFTRYLLVNIQNADYLGTYHNNFIFHQALKLRPDLLEYSPKLNFYYHKMLLRTGKIKEIPLNLLRKIPISIINDKVTFNDEFIDTHWNFLIQRFSYDKVIFKTAEDFDEININLIKTMHGFQELEALCYKLLGVFLKDITLSGEFEIVFKDFLYVLEADGKLDLLITQ